MSDKTHYNDNMRILLISANTEPFPEPVFPVGAVYVGNALQCSGAQVRIFDMRHNASNSSLEKALASFRPDRIGISLRNVDNAAYPSTRFYLPAYASLVKKLRAAHPAPILLGGPAFSLFPQEITACLGTDGGVIGDGEGAADVFLNTGPGNIIKVQLPDLENVAFPRNIDVLFPDFRKYRTFGVQTARGCPNQCIYCTYPMLEGKRRRTRSPGIVAEEIAMLYRDFGIRNFFMVDSLFNTDEDHMANVAEKIAKQNLPIRFSCYLQPKVSDPGIFRVLKKAGCVAVDFGTDSGSPEMLAAFGKPFGINDIQKASRACLQSGIDFCHSLILGGPGENEKTIRETVSLMDEISPRAVIAMTGVRIYPGTWMETVAVKEGLVAAGESLFEPRFYFPQMGPSAFLKLVTDATGGRSNWFFPGKKDWGSTVGYKMLHFLYRKGPLWRTFQKVKPTNGGGAWLR
ncbi:MAG: radical SAM protein [Desulfosalsimonadaceae bacterium]